MAAAGSQGGAGGFWGGRGDASQLAPTYSPMGSEAQPLPRVSSWHRRRDTPALPVPRHTSAPRATSALYRNEISPATLSLSGGGLVTRPPGPATAPPAGSTSATIPAGAATFTSGPAARNSSAGTAPVTLFASDTQSGTGAAGSHATSTSGTADSHSAVTPASGAADSQLQGLIQGHRLTAAPLFVSLVQVSPWQFSDLAFYAWRTGIAGVMQLLQTRFSQRKRVWP